jgi:hypothetical protein
MRKAVVDFTGLDLKAVNLRPTWYQSLPEENSEEAVLSHEARRPLTDELVRRARPYLTFTLLTDEVWLAELNAVTEGYNGSTLTHAIHPKWRSADLEWLDCSRDRFNSPCWSFSWQV